MAPLERHKRFLLPEQTKADTVKAHVDWSAHYHALIRLTMLGMDVLEDTQQSVDMDTVHATLLNALGDRGLLTATAMVRRVPFSSEFLHRYQFLSGHPDFTPALSPQDIAILQRSFIHPAPARSAIHNLLLIDWLFGSWQAFHQHCHWQATMDCTPYQQARYASPLSSLGLEHCREFESVLIDGALGVPVGAGRLYGFRAKVAPDGFSRDTQTPRDLSQWEPVSNVPASNNAQ